MKGEMMSRLSEIYDIRLACYEDIENIMKFLDDHWKKNHLMAKNRPFFEYEFYNGKDVQFVLAIRKETDEIEALYGYVYSSHTDGKKDIWGSFWKANSKKCEPLIGIEVAKKVKELSKCRYMLGVGANPKTTVPIMKKVFKIPTVKLKHYYFLNTSYKDYLIADIKIKRNHKTAFCKLKRPICFETFEHLKSCFDVEGIDAIPYKDNWYLEHRFYTYPWFKYMVYGIPESDANNIGALIVLREILVKDRKILRIVDYLGEQRLFENLGNFFADIIKDYEYIDFYEYGFEDIYIENCGFFERNEEDENVIPNYFEPFGQNNVDIWGFYDSPNVLITKADGDQDRPNIDRGEL
ncbi:MAG: hypothetical protein NC489_34200 [Ruminococcus flavefaciens]|nr:hypothetical protein [Ruminococcus flavefaciens]